MNGESEARLAIARRAAKILQRDNKIIEVWLFGSTAQGRANLMSDIDIAVVANIPSTNEAHEALKKRFADQLKGADSDLRMGGEQMELDIGIITVSYTKDEKKSMKPFLSSSIASGVQLY